MKGRLDVKEAVQKAKEYISEVFADETIRGVRLEEVALDEGTHIWQVTIGFHRMVDGFLPALAAEERAFKVVQIDDRSGRVVAITHRDLTLSN